MTKKMAWRPSRYLIKGELDNTELGKVTGWMRFAGVRGQVTFDLKGDFHRDIRGAKICFTGKAKGNEPGAKLYMEDLAKHQKGAVGDMTAGLPPADYVSGFCYLEWYDDFNSRVVIVLGQDQVEVIGAPLPPDECEPVSRCEQNRNMAQFLAGLAGQSARVSVLEGLEEGRITSCIWICSEAPSGCCSMLGPCNQSVYPTIARSRLTG